MTTKEIKKITQTAIFYLNQYNYNMLRGNDEIAKEYLIRYEAITFTMNTDFNITVEKVRLFHKDLFAGVVVTKKNSDRLYGTCLTYDDSLDNMCKECVQEFLTVYGFYSEAINIYG